MAVVDQPSAMIRLADLVSELTDLDEATVLLGYGDRPRPSTPHMTLIPLADTGRGRPARNADDLAEHARELRVLFTAYGETHVAALRSMALLLWTDADEMFDFVADGMSIIAVGPVEDQTALKATSYEPRAAMTVTCGYVQTEQPSAPPEAAGVTVSVNFTNGVIDVPSPPPEP